MKSSYFAGIDLSLKKQKTSLCIIKPSKTKINIVFLKHDLNENKILEIIKKFRPLYTSIDAPFIFNKREDRKEDKKLRKILKEKEIKRFTGVLPFYIKTMIGISTKGYRLYKSIKKYTKVLETHPTASIRISGFNQDYKKSKKELHLLLEKLKNKFNGIELVKTDDDLDALISSVFSLYFHLNRNIIILRKKVPYGILEKL